MLVSIYQKRKMQDACNVFNIKPDQKHEQNDLLNLLNEIICGKIFSAETNILAACFYFVNSHTNEICSECGHATLTRRHGRLINALCAICDSYIFHDFIISKTKPFQLWNY